jgi:hypothetical protein
VLGLLATAPRPPLHPRRTPSRPARRSTRLARRLRRACRGLLLRRTGLRPRHRPGPSPERRALQLTPGPSRAIPQTPTLDGHHRPRTGGPLHPQRPGPAHRPGGRARRWGGRGRRLVRDHGAQQIVFYEMSPSCCFWPRRGDGSGNSSTRLSDLWRRVLRNCRVPCGCSSASASLGVPCDEHGLCPRAGAGAHVTVVVRLWPPAPNMHDLSTSRHVHATGGRRLLGSRPADRRPRTEQARSSPFTVAGGVGRRRCRGRSVPGLGRAGPVAGASRWRACCRRRDSRRRR